jgi:hypothetical protein
MNRAKRITQPPKVGNFTPTKVGKFTSALTPPKNESKIARKPSPNPRFLAKPVTSIHPKPAEK